MLAIPFFFFSRAEGLALVLWDTVAVFWVSLKINLAFCPRAEFPFHALPFQSVYLYIKYEGWHPEYSDIAISSVHSLHCLHDSCLSLKPNSSGKSPAGQWGCVRYGWQTSRSLKNLPCFWDKTLYREHVGKQDFDVGRDHPVGLQDLTCLVDSYMTL